MVSVDSSSNHLQLEAIPLLDIHLLSQSELNSLSLCSDEAFDLHSCDDVVIPKIDRSVFNESAGSRKQTYSRFRLAPRKPEITNVGRRRRSAGLLPLPKPPPNPVDDPERKENQRIATLLRELFVKDNSVESELIRIDSEHRESQLQPVPLKVDNGVFLQQSPLVVACKEVTKRGRKRKYELKPPQVQGDGNGNFMNNAMVVYENKLNPITQTMNIVNRNGVAVDVAALANLQDPFGPELRRRSIGLETEAALLGFLKDLKGQWGSRRMKRKIVDASDFGDTLPKGWKLLLALRRREGRVALNCRRYISPNGHQFVTCKEVSSFLLSYFGPQYSGQQNSGHSDRNTQQIQKLASESNAGLTCQHDNSKEDPLCYSTSPITSQSIDYEKQVALLRVENLAEVQVRDLLECHKCNIIFEEKDAYLRHLLSSHQRAAKRRRLGLSVTDGVIIKDGKYECQFCHKIFEERTRYTGHVGVHVRNYVRNLETLPSPITVQKSIASSSSGAVPSVVRMMDSSVYINKGSTPETCTAKPNDELNVGSVHCKPDVNSTRATPGESHREWIISSSHRIQVTEADKSSIPEVTNAKLNERNVGSLHAKLKEASILEIPTSRSICELHDNSSHSKQVEEAFKDSIPDTTVARLYDGQNINSLYSKQDPSSILEPLSGEPMYESNVAALQGNLVKEARKECSPETSTAKPDDEQNASSFHSKLKEVSIQEPPVDESNFKLNVGSCQSKLITEASKDSVPKIESIDGSNVGALHIKQDETLGGKSKCDLNVISSHNKHDMEANKFEATLVEKSYSESFCDSRMPDSKSGMTGEANNVGNGKISNCMDCGIVLSNQKECNTLETFDGNGSSAVTSFKDDKCDIEPEGASRSCSLIPGNGQICGLEGDMNEVRTSFTKVPKLDEMEKPGINGLESGSAGCHPGPNKDVVTVTHWASDEENEPENGAADSSFPLMQPSVSNDELGSVFAGYDAGPNKEVAAEITQTADEGNVPESALADFSFPSMQSSVCFPDPNRTPEKAENEICNIKKLENMSDFEALKLDDIQPSRFGFMTQQESRSLPEQSIGFAYNAALEQVDSTIHFEWEPHPRMAGTNHLTTVCIWCRIEFNHGALDSGMHSDSLGFVCPACKAKISENFTANKFSCSRYYDCQKGSFPCIY
ncbi:hypothetical protein NE237_018192 [Protea cynaroides]|uniref:Uncharacterized protein n=1 Tax=Protea cynaroides TaxID=273540 RepID=A0A9Q0QNS5_9MAGN|nr:hypothetical protein NE237_018192 [Protea cynaroides]